MSQAVKVSHHANKRATERFGVKQEDATKWIRDQYASAIYVGDTIDSSGAKRKLYSNGSVIFGVSIEDGCVVTVFKPTSKHREIKSKVTEFVAKEVRKIDRRLQKSERVSSIKIAELRLEIATLELRKVKSRSTSVIAACDARIGAICQELGLIEAEIKEAVSERHLALKTYAAYV
ncbi:hypothetical protein MH117_09905 [Paenibacillus sp. ACRRX]|uniref:hypothetical protein n=1 Tax=Paenibacillus sp. ACRRX TaxID=2918206 RepID=UPI001EF6D57C|nr:hypothetical protein [Paenibacillus sp. ACRRX]MCG7407737.1 hypothetical protein [Paenibacillus sp. ACRRX]